MKIKYHIVAVFFLLLFTVPLRFINLGYSEYQDDEKKSFFRPALGQTAIEFFMSQRKGPAQFAVSYIPYLFTHDFMNEYAERLPFALTNIASVILLYFLLSKLTNSSLGSFLGALLYAVNGFIVGFSRISQYQNLNLLFSFASLYFYYDLTNKSSKLITRSLLGASFFVLSLFSHWDAIYYVPLYIYFFILFFRRKDLTALYKQRVFLLNLVFGIVLVLPLILPYIFSQTRNSDNMAYFHRRIGLSDRTWEFHKYVFELYNPYITLYLLAALSAVSLFFIRSTAVYIVWFLINLFAIKFFMVKPGTHVYNYFIPVIFVIAFGWAGALKKMSKYTRPLFAVLSLVVGSVLFYQSYLLFVDHSVEYPWESKMVFGNSTVPLYNEEIVTFGFPHFRDWKNINNYVVSQNDNCTYISNEGKEITQIYMQFKYGVLDRCYYIISVRRPFINIRDGVAFGGLNGKKPVYSYYKNGDWVTKVYDFRKDNALSEK